MPKTALEMKRRALQVLGVLAGGQPMSAEDADAIDLDAVAARLAAERIADITAYVAAGDLPDDLHIAFCDVVAADHAVIFGTSVTDSVQLQMKGEDALRRIIRRTRPVVQSQIDKITGC
jgi:hypothetical protein